MGDTHKSYGYPRVFRQSTRRICRQLQPHELPDDQLQHQEELREPHPEPPQQLHLLQLQEFSEQDEQPFPLLSPYWAA